MYMYGVYFDLKKKKSLIDQINSEGIWKIWTFPHEVVCLVSKNNLQ